MAGIDMRTGSRRMAELINAARELLNSQPETVRRHSDRIVCITRFLCAQYTRTLGSKTIPVKDLPVIYVGAALHDMEWTQVCMLLDKVNLRKNEKDLIERICLHHHEIHPLHDLEGAAALYPQIVGMADCYDALTMGEEATCSHWKAVKRIVGGSCGKFDPVLMRCLEGIHRELQALLECKDNQRRVNLLQNIYRGDQRHYWLYKRLFDVIVSLAALAVLWPVMLLISIAVVIDDPKGGPFFEQIRVGRHKKCFLMYKFRTMCVDAEAKRKQLEKMNEKDGPVFKMTNDPRITRVGRFLRRTSLDELPQLFNVLKGQMTLVGPRPPLPKEVSQYTHYEEMRLSVTPGLTCVWQVQPHRDQIPFEKWVDLDLEYIGTRSVWLDTWLVMKTVVAVFRQSGS